MNNGYELAYLDNETAIRANQIAGESGAVRDMNGLGSAMVAPRNAALYQQSNIVEQAAILIQRIALNHPFFDGNKRAAFILGSTLLMRNGYQLAYQNEHEEMELAYTIESMIAEKKFENLVQWIEKHLIASEDKESSDIEQVMQFIAKSHPRIIKYLGEN
ncbi:hypothetical protein KDA_56780 [Dictyobacter alpinus]|uniref:Fido domain-containing protein n=1 Tax=Dictyobacter alpinus TaxID=2014873 RepID=A0A402BFP9_9CHLR|nr:type II toxin-antitoxin system death-on-curing family toxin [Dictyobacter alpinus]GCE30194.1 hypothetical protein KDA_56780 [Dictyobacter alpinus]